MFQVNESKSLKISGLRLQDGMAKGEDGDDRSIQFYEFMSAPPGGSGAAGYGGAILLLGASTLSASQCVFANNYAEGGNGGNGGVGKQGFTWHGSPGGRGGDAAGGAICGLINENPDQSIAPTISLTLCTFTGNRAVAGNGGAGRTGSIDPNVYVYAVKGVHGGGGGDGGDGGQAVGGAVATVYNTSNTAAISILGTAKVTSCLFDDNQTVGGSGGLAGKGADGVVGSTFPTENMNGGGGGGGGMGGQGGFSSGGAICVYNPEVVNSTLVRNKAFGGNGSASQDGGNGASAGAYINGIENIVLIGVMGTGGVAIRGGRGGSVEGGAIYAHMGSTVQCTLFGNEARAGFGGNGGNGGNGVVGIILDLPDGYAISKTSRSGEGGNGGTGGSGRGGAVGGQAAFKVVDGQIVFIQKSINYCTFSTNAALAGSGGQGGLKGRTEFAYFGFFKPWDGFDAGAGTAKGGAVGEGVLYACLLEKSGGGNVEGYVNDPPYVIGKGNVDAPPYVIDNGLNICDDDTLKKDTNLDGVPEYTTSRNNTSPEIGPLANNGGPLPTMALLGGSPAINAGDPNFDGTGQTDQRGSGYPRVVFGRIDIGAFERQNDAVALPSLSINNVTANEGNSDTTTFTFTVTRSGDTTRTSSVNYVTSDGTATAGSDYVPATVTRSGDTTGTSSVDYVTSDGVATAGSDYVPANGTLNYAAGETNKIITVTVTGDLGLEPNETFNVTLSNPTGATIATAMGIGTILNDDEMPSLIVTTTNDVMANDGLTSLREAIAYANSKANTNASTPDVITFNIPGAGTRTIALTSALPIITDRVIIDGTSQPGFSVVTHQPVIELNGANAGTEADGLVIRAGGSTVKGLVINRFAGQGILIQWNGGNTIQGNYIGTDATGTVALGNGETGIYNDDQQQNLIGGSAVAGEGNLISGNAKEGIWFGWAAHNNQVQGNYIGTNSNGTGVLGNGYSGVALMSGSGNLVGGTAEGARNIISGNGDSGILLDWGGTNNTIQGNYIGTDLTGTVDLGNAHSGILLGGGGQSYSVIGGATASARNIISGNGWDGISMAYGDGHHIIQGNYIGTDVTGTKPLGNDGHGVTTGNQPFNLIGGSEPGEGNVISGNQSEGILIGWGESNANTIQGNYIGTNSAGTAAISNGGDGIWVVGGADNQIGGTSQGARNIISGNGGNGLTFYNATGNKVQGNSIGTDVTGSIKMGNADGILLGGASDNTIGGSTEGEGNVISGNRYSGIWMPDSDNNTIQGNLIGTAADGKTLLGNTFSGVATRDGVGNTIGGTVQGAGNIIAGNTQSGVEIHGSEATGNTVQGNSIFSNGKLGIELMPAGVNTNDDRDADGGPNSLQNYPVLRPVFNTAGGIIIRGSLNSTPNAAFILDFYSNAEADASGYGEGQTPIGSQTVTTDTNGNAAFSVTLPGTVPVGYLVSATATSASGDTSEFSRAVALNSAPIAEDQTVTTNEDEAVTITLSAADADGDTLTYAITQLPAHGELSVNGINITALGAITGNKVTYTPDANYPLGTMKNGPDDFSFAVSDGTAESEQATVSITVTAICDAPIGGDDSYEVDEDGTLTVSAPGVLWNDKELDGEPLTAIKVTNPAHGTLTLKADGSFIYKPNANYNGPDSFTYQANDGFWPSETVTVTITVKPVNDAPVAEADSYSVDEDNVLTVAQGGLLANDSDVDSTTLTVALVNDVAHGTLALNDNGTFTYTPNANYNGADSFTYKANDGALNSNAATVTITVKPVNDAPSARVTLSPANPKTSDTLTAGITTSDVDGDTVTKSIVWKKNGTPIDGETGGALDLSKSGNGNKGDVMTVEVTPRDGTENGAIATAQATILNSAPTANAQSVITNEDTAKSIALATNDADGDTLTYSIVVGPAQGKLSGTAPNLTYTPNANYHGSDSFTFKASDGTADSNVAAVSITINSVNDAPSFTRGANQTVKEDAGAQTVAGWASAISTGPADEAGQKAAFHVTNNNNALFSQQPIIASNGTLTYTPAPNANGSATVTVILKDNGGTANGGVDTSATQSFTITVTPVNDLPVAVNDSYSTPAKQMLGVAAPGVLRNDTDVENSPLTATLVKTTANGSLTFNTNGSFVYTPNNTFVGDDSFTYQANDGTAAGNVATVTIAVTSTKSPGTGVSFSSGSASARNNSVTLAFTGGLDNVSAGAAATYRVEVYRGSTTQMQGFSIAAATYSGANFTVTLSVVGGLQRDDRLIAYWTNLKEAAPSANSLTGQSSVITVK